MVLDPQPARRHKRFDAEVLARLDSLRQGTPADVLLQASRVSGAAPVRELMLRARLPVETAAAALDELLENGQLLRLEAGQYQPSSDLLVIDMARWQTETDKAIGEVSQYHRRFPLRPGMPREELKSRLKMSPRLFSAALRRWLFEGKLLEKALLLTHPDYRVVLTPVQQAQVEHLVSRFIANPFGPPTIKECLAELGEELYGALVEGGQLFPVSPEVVFRKMDYDILVAAVRMQLEQEGTLTLAQFRDRFQTSRKYAQAFMEHLDATGVTQRDGDARKLFKK